MKNKPTQSKPKAAVNAGRSPRSRAAHGSTPTLSQCYLEHAARETQWAAESSKQCDYQTAANALTRRGVWLMAALIAQERKA